MNISFDLFRRMPMHSLILRHRFKLVLLLLSFLASNVWAQQTIIIKGKVIDLNTKEPVIGANIRIKGTPSGTVTDINGNFSLEARQDLPVKLIISSIGYRNQDLEVYEVEDLVIPLFPESRNLNDVVIIGYTQNKRKTLASAVTTVSSEDIANTSYTSVTEKLQGQVPGLMISSNSGVPGASVLVRLRGATSIAAGNNPLYVVDGVFINSESLQGVQRGLGGQVSDPLSDINPDDIESVSVLKDANATALYGSQGANGVILITTKRGARNSKSTIQFQSELGLAKATNLWKLVSGPEHAEVVNACWINDGKSYATRPFRPKSEIITGYAAYGNPEEQQTYDRLGLIFRTAMLQKYALSISGGDKRNNFLIGGEYQKQEAALKLEDFERYAFRLNFDHSLSDNLKVGTSNSISLVKRQIVRVGDGPAGLFQAALHTPTFYPVLNDDGSYYKPVSFDNVLAILENSDNHANSIRSINNIYAKWDLTKNLSFKSSWSNDYNNYHELAYYNTNLIYGQPAGEANDVITSKQTLSTEQLLNFNKTFKNSSEIAAFIGNTVQKTIYERENIVGTGFPSNDFKRISSAATQTASSSGSSSSLLSYFAGANFSYKSLYIIDVNMRADASSRFGTDNRWGYFPSVGAVWNIANESFFPKTKAINDLRLRASLGYTGNENISDFASRGLWTGGSNYDGVAGIAPSQLANPDLKWETTRQWNLGFVGALIDNRIEFDVNYYDKYTYDLLLNDPVPAKTGYSSVTRNVGAMSNKGFEIALNTTNVKSRNFVWATSFTISHNDNKVEKLNSTLTSNYTAYQVQQGFPLYSIWVYKYLGVNPKTGDAIYKDRTGEGKITVDDKEIVGNAWPKFEGFFKNSFSFKGFDLAISIFFKSGNKIYNYTSSFLESGGTRGVTRSMLKSTLNYWKKEGDTNVLPRPKSVANSDGSFNYDQQSSRFVEDGSYIRLKEISLGYTLPANTLKFLHISSARLYVVASNLYTLTNYSGPDPEVNVGGDTQGLVQGMDFGTPPQPVSASVGINLNF